MKPKKRIAVDQLPAVAKRFNAIPQRMKTVKGTKIKYEGLQFRNEFVRSFFPKKDAWVGRAFVWMWETRTEEYRELLARMRAHLKKAGVKTSGEIDAIIERKMEQTLKRMDFVTKTLTEQRSKLKQLEVGNAYHGVLGVFTGMKTACEKISQGLRKARGLK